MSALALFGLVALYAAIWACSLVVWTIVLIRWRRALRRRRAMASTAHALARHEALRSVLRAAYRATAAKLVREA